MRGRSLSLRRRLVIGVSALVAIAFLVTGTTTLLAVRASALQRLDGEVLVGLDLAVQPHGGPGPEGGDGSPTNPPQTGTGSDSGGDPAPRIGTLTLVLDAQGTVEEASVIGDDGTASTLTDAHIAQLTADTLPERRPVSVDLGDDLGSYRIAVEHGTDRTVVSGRSLADVTDSTRTTAATLGGVMGGVLLLVIAGLVLVITRSLRPLRRLARTAQRVSERELASGDVVLPDRVDPADTDPATEVGQVGGALNSLLDHIEDALTRRQAAEDRLRRFVADASHELRTPLASIHGYAQLTQAEGAPMTATQQRSLTRISSEAVRMTSLVEDLLLLARLDAGQPLRQERVDLAVLLIDALSDAHAASPEHRWVLEVEEPVEVTGDEDRLRQVLTNLLGNARAHTPAGSTVTASLDGNAEPGTALIRVSDDGPGIPEDLRERLFERFARGDGSRSRTRPEGQADDEDPTVDAGSGGGLGGGAGLGLAISHAIVTAHGGSLDVQSAPGRTVFTVRLPLMPALTATTDGH
ncbi:HAMP domain-containing sensor histidine kinase [Brachybacterium sp.]|uniref:sensor histidine kinase n=1 Tax=Brachybacterium sp. TaxID=1891286 RepID=UPI002ED45000